MARKDYIDKINKNMEKLTKDELKDVATLTNVQFGVRLKVAEKEYWEKEVEAIKSKLQQQDLPVVPECVAKFVSSDENELSKADRIAYLLKSVQGDSYYLTVELPGDGTITVDEGQELYNWAICQHHETILELWNGYTVEKPQLFYLKHIDMSKRNSINDLYLKKYIHADLTENGEHRLSHAMSAKGIYPSKEYCAFTQQEIDSMQTGSYKKIPVPVEDGE
jgi:hypothetical protein